MENKIEIIEWYDRSIPLYEIMLTGDYTLKSMGKPYNVLYRSDFIPFVEFNIPEEGWRMIKKVISIEEAINKFGEFKIK